MSYTVRWKVKGKDRIAAPPPHERPSQAMDYACVVLAEFDPPEIWIEDEGGARIADKEKITQHCKEQSKKAKPRGKV